MKASRVIAALLCLAGGCPPAFALDYEEYPSVRLRSLDKVTARTLTFDAQVGSTIKFGDIYIKVQSCRKPPPVEKSEAASFLQIWQIDKTNQESRWVFSGWMYASSPALSGMDHPVYDVWVIDCLGKDPEALPPEESKQSEALPGEGQVPEGKVAEPSVAPEEQAPLNPSSSPVEDGPVEEVPSSADIPSDAVSASDEPQVSSPATEESTPSATEEPLAPVEQQEMPTMDPKEKENIDGIY